MSVRKRLAEVERGLAASRNDLEILRAECAKDYAHYRCDRCGRLRHVSALVKPSEYHNCYLCLKCLDGTPYDRRKKKQCATRSTGSGQAEEREGEDEKETQDN